jgi:four helix bundle protein
LTIENFRDLKVWNLGKLIVKDVYLLTDQFPKSEMYGLVSQMRRAAVSIPSNVAEGFNRYHNNEYRQYLYVALGSCAELETQLEISKDLEFIETDSKDIIIEKINYETGMLRNLIKKL